MTKALAVARKELRQIVRDRRSLLVLLFVPVFFLLVFGYALNFDLRNVRLAVEDNDRTAASRSIVSAFVNSGHFDVVAFVEGDEDVDRLIDEGRARAVLVIPAGLQQKLLTGSQVPVQVVVDGENANAATTVVAYALGILQSVSAQYAVRPLVTPSGPPVSVEPRVWYNPELRSALFLVPGLIAYIGMISAVVSTALSVVLEKERGTMEQIRMAPIGTLSYTVGKALPYFGISIVTSLGIILASMGLFGLPMNGSWFVLLLAISLFLAGALALGLLISTVAESQQVAFQLALLASFLPTLMLSGFIFPIASMPAPIRFVTYVVPARYFLAVLRGVVLKGAGLAAFWPQLAALALFTALLLTLASIRLKRQWA